MTQFTASLIATDATERERFLDALRATGCVAAAARATGTTRSTAYALRRRDPVFAAAWAAIIGAAVTARAGDALEAALIARATHGSERYRFLAGRGVEIWREFDHRLGLQLLKKLMPARYGDGGAAAVEPVRTMTRDQFIAAIRARPRTVDLVPIADAEG